MPAGAGQPGASARVSSWPGRPAEQLSQVFAQDRGTHLLPEGLPARMDANIRALLLEGTLSQKYDLPALDADQSPDRS